MSRSLLRPRLAYSLAAILSAGSLLAAPAVTAAPAPDPASAATFSAGPLEPVERLDVDRYLGRWYQVAAIPQIYTLQCWSGTTADYARVNADTISVRNTCLTLAKRESSVTGTADVLDPVTQAQLRVTFEGVPPVGDPTTPNYVVTALADDYSWALVGDPDRRSGFVLSRTGAVTTEQWAQIKAAVVEAGYDTHRFWTTPQEGGETRPRPLGRVG